MKKIDYKIMERIKLEFPNETLQGESQSMILVILIYRYQ